MGGKLLFLVALATTSAPAINQLFAVPPAQAQGARVLVGSNPSPRYTRTWWAVDNMGDVYFGDGYEVVGSWTVKGHIPGTPVSMSPGLPNSGADFYVTTTTGDVYVGAGTGDFPPSIYIWLVGNVFGGATAAPRPSMGQVKLRWANHAITRTPGQSETH